MKDIKVSSDMHKRIKITAIEEGKGMAEFTADLLEAGFKATAKRRRK